MVRVLTVDQVTPEASSSLYAATRDTVPLSLFDAYWITLPPIQRLFLFPKTSVPFSSITNSLKSSLSKTLTKFPLLAGKLTYLPSTDDVIVDLRQATGVEFIEAESDADVNKLAGDPVHDTEAFISLVPDIDTRSMPMPVMAVMATVFAGGGVAVGVTVHHAVADGKGVWMFMDMWAASCRGEDAVSLPVHDRAVIVREGGEEIARRFVKALAPEIPKFSSFIIRKSNFLSSCHRCRLILSLIEHRLRLQRRTFILSSSAVQSLKDRILSQSNGSHSPSTFTAISAHAWVSIAKTIAFAAIDVTNLVFLADCRSRLNPPLPSSYAGNCVGPCYATAMWHALLGPQGLLLAQAEVARAVQEGTKDPLRGCENWVEEFMGIAESGRVVVSGSPRFRVYETDFGWGELGRVELVSMNKDMEVVLVGGREPGSVQVSIVLDPGQMRLFAEVFLDGLGV